MDFRNLTDDQLVELVRSLCFEAAQRGWAVQQAAQAAMLSEAEKARIATEAAEKEAERLREKEAERIAAEAAEKVRREVAAAQSQAEAAQRKKRDQKLAALAEAIYEVLGYSGHSTITLWFPSNKPGTDRRIYCDEGDGYVRRGWKVYVHVDGTHRVRPGTVTGAEGYKAEALRQIAEIIVANWPSLELSTKVYTNRDDLERGGQYAEQYRGILEQYRAAKANIERLAEERRAAEAEKRAAEAARNARFAEAVSAELLPLRELLKRHGCTGARLMSSKLGGNHIIISLDPTPVRLYYRRYEVRLEQSVAADYEELTAAAIEVLKKLYDPLQKIALEQPPTITLTPADTAEQEVAHG